MRGELDSREVGLDKIIRGARKCCTTSKKSCDSIPKTGAHAGKVDKGQGYSRENPSMIFGAVVHGTRIDTPILAFNMNSFEHQAATSAGEDH